MHIIIPFESLNVIVNIALDIKLTDTSMARGSMMIL